MAEIGLIAVTLLVLAVIAVAYLLFTTVWAAASDVAKTLVMASISVFAWIILWASLEALLFEWAAPARENKALAHIMGMQVATLMAVSGASLAIWDALESCSLMGHPSP